jgi:outer membrane lipoprotein-sorting protein
MKKATQILFFNFFFVAICIAQKAKTILDDAAKAYEKSNGISAQFSTHIQNEKQGISESYEGSIQMRGDKFALITPDMRIWYDGTTMWTLLTATDEVNLSIPPDDDLQFSNPMILLTTYKKGFNPSYIGESTADSGKAAYDVRLTSKNRSDIDKIEVQIEKNTSLPSRV